MTIVSTQVSQTIENQMTIGLQKYAYFDAHGSFYLVNSS